MAREACGVGGYGVKAFYQDEKVKLYQSDVLEWALDYKKKIDAGKAFPFHSICADPPYGLGDPPPIAELLNAWLNKEEYNTGCGFMNSHWDVVPSPKYWRALLDIVFPGGYMFLFSGTRTADLLGISCRLGGWEPFDRVTNFMWCYGSGFPKSHSISRALDASEVVHCPDCPGGYILSFSDEIAQEWAMERDTTVAEAVSALSDGCEACKGTGQIVGVEREVVGQSIRRGDKKAYLRNVGYKGGTNFPIADNNFITAPATPLAQAFDGYGTALKPAGEPILLLRKPREGRTFAECAREFGSGGLDVDSSRVKTDDGRPHRTKIVHRNKKTSEIYGNGMASGTQSGMATGTTSQGRWPPNTHFAHIPHHSRCSTCEGDGCDECHGEGAVGGCRRVGSKRVKVDSGGDVSDKTGPRKNQVYGGHKADRTAFVAYKGVDGREEVADWICHPQCAVRALDEMAPHSKSSGGAGSSWGKAAGVHGGWKRKAHENYQAQPPGTYAVDEGGPSRFFPNHDWSYEIAERLAGETPFRYCAKASNSERSFGLAEFLPRTKDLRKRRRQDTDGSWLVRATCKHPTVKPLSLLIWLAKLCKPPDIFNPRICMPFSGVLSETIAARLAGWKNITAIERERVYCEWGVARWKGMDKWATLTGKTDPATIRKLGEVAEARVELQDGEQQTSLFDAMGLE